MSSGCQLLCERCKAIDIWAALRTPAEVIGGFRRIADLGLFLEPSLCALCTFFYDITHMSKRGSGTRWSLCAITSLYALGIRVTARALRGSPTVALMLQPEGVGRIEFASKYGLILEADKLPQSHTASSKYHYYGRPICTNQINFELLREWIDDCENGHKSCKTSPRNTIEAFKVIDCQTGSIVVLPPAENYITLSYVWGENFSQNEGSKEFEKPGPDAVQTVSDAMKVVLNLGRRYLWVDRHCINQTDEKEKQELVPQMDKIYEGAFVTLVALGENACYGLHGISRHRRAQPSFASSNGILVSTMAEAFETLQSSPWNRRGWTYQEFCLSRRCLVFSVDQVHFICRSGITCESVQHAPVSTLSFQKVKGLDPRLLASRGGALASNVGGPLFMRHIDAYCIRNLSFESDALDAIGGILSRSTLNNYMGVPLFKEHSRLRHLDAYERGFAHGLAWINTQPQILRKLDLFPSWSWISNRGRKYFPISRPYTDRKRSKLSFDLAFRDENIVSNAQFYVYEEDGRLKRLFQSSDAHQLQPFGCVMGMKRYPLEVWSDRGRIVADMPLVKPWFDCKGEIATVESQKIDLLMLFKQSKEMEHMTTRGAQQWSKKRKRDTRDPAEPITTPGSTYWLIVKVEGSIASRLGVLAVPREFDDAVEVTGNWKVTSI